MPGAPSVNRSLRVSRDSQCFALRMRCTCARSTSATVASCLLQDRLTAFHNYLFRSLTTSWQQKLHLLYLSHTQVVYWYRFFSHFRLQSCLMKQTTGGVVCAVLDRGLSTISHCLELYKLVLRTRLSNPACNIWWYQFCTLIYFLSLTLNKNPAVRNYQHFCFSCFSVDVKRAVLPAKVGCPSVSSSVCKIDVSWPNKFRYMGNNKVTR